MKKFHHHTFLLVLAIAVTILVGVVYGYMYYVVRFSIVRAAAARDIVALEKANKDRESDVRALYQRTKNDRDSLFNFFVPSDRIVDFIEAIEKIGPETGSEVALSIKTLEDNNGRGIAEAHVEVNGSWTSVMRAISLAENLPYLVNVYGTHLSSSIGAKGKHVWKANFIVSVVLSEPLSSLNK